LAGRDYAPGGARGRHRGARTQEMRNGFDSGEFLAALR